MNVFGRIDEAAETLSKGFECYGFEARAKASRSLVATIAHVGKIQIE